VTTASGDGLGIAARLFLATVAAAARLNSRCARLGEPFVYENSAFPWAGKLEREWRTIRGELDRLLARKGEMPPVQDIVSGAVAITRDADWKIFVLMFHGVKSPPNIALCPETWQLVRQVPGLRSALFSIFEPGKRLLPHCGPYNGILRLHLGLIVPEPEGAAIRIGAEVRHWREGEALIFDDAHEHETWNATAHPRVVLFIDFLKPLRFPANLTNRLLLTAALLSSYVRQGRTGLRQWERQFHADRG
jgi:aspartyl/asparaginyl beta-hydroxylase (cupin superfamily)